MSERMAGKAAHDRLELLMEAGNPPRRWHKPLCTRAELWAAIEAIQAKAERYGIGLELDGPEDQERAMTELIAARKRVRALLGMEWGQP